MMRRKLASNQQDAHSYYLLDPSTWTDGHTHTANWTPRAVDPVVSPETTSGSETQITPTGDRPVLAWCRVEEVNAGHQVKKIDLWSGPCPVAPTAEGKDVLMSPSPETTPGSDIHVTLDATHPDLVGGHETSDAKRSDLWSGPCPPADTADTTETQQTTGVAIGVGIWTDEVTFDWPTHWLAKAQTPNSVLLGDGGSAEVASQSFIPAPQSAGIVTLESAFLPSPAVTTELAGMYPTGSAAGDLASPGAHGLALAIGTDTLHFLG